MSTTVGLLESYPKDKAGRQGEIPSGDFVRKDRREFLSFRLEVWVKFSVGSLGCLGYLLGDGDFTLPETHIAPD